MRVFKLNRADIKTQKFSKYKLSINLTLVQNKSYQSPITYINFKYEIRFYEAREACLLLPQFTSILTLTYLCSPPDYSCVAGVAGPQ